MTVIKDPQIEQDRAVEQGNKYIKETLNEILGRARRQATEAKREGNDSKDPFYTMFEQVGTFTEKLSNMLQSINSDTTMTADNASLMQMGAIDRAVKAYGDIIANGKADINTIENSLETKLFSRSAVLTPETMALLGNDTLMKEMRGDYTPFADNERSAVLLNTFNKFGVLGDKNHAKSIDTSLDSRYSQGEVMALKRISGQKETTNELEQTVKQTLQRLSTNPERIASIRAKKIA